MFLSCFFPSDLVKTTGHQEKVRRKIKNSLLSKFFFQIWKKIFCIKVSFLAVVHQFNMLHISRSLSKKCLFQKHQIEIEFSSF